ncbi:WSC domain-containing protein [Lachnellula suecica]|uniref:WSC domain-containing protein n=1 Tax=Lachnellula suecica TaxID=602035 RepID=A0A8T9C0Q3_9HELO|nr:WSC domain-containing protein [Lachnellula suecica]
MWPTLLSIVAFLPIFVHSLGLTDEIQDADPAQSGYLDNHNMHPATVGSPIFGTLWKNTYGPKEKWYAKPLVYTPPGGSQLVFLASSMNIIRTLDAVNGTLLSSRTVQPPFLQSDIGCTDIPDYIGVVGTPIIDPNTSTAYFFSKGYKNGAANGGVANGIYNFYAVDVNTLKDRPGFPVLIDGHFADNDNTRYFVGGTVLQRPSLSMINGTVLGGFGGHCDLFNYTGMIVAVSTTPGVGVTSLFAMEAAPGASPAVTDITVQKGGKAGIWQSGMGFATDGNRFFAVTGNGQGHQNGDVPSSGRVPLSTLDEVVGTFTLSASGQVSLTDYFEPFEYLAMDAGDKDLGASGVTLLDAGAFNGKGVSRIGITVGKNSKVYVMNANNLGGFKQAPGGVDNIIQTILPPASVFAGTGSYPLEGGFIYFTPVGFPTFCYKIGQDSQGAPLFTWAGNTATNGAGRVGIGVPTVTSYKGQAGTGILWIPDPNVGLQAFKAVPVNGVLEAIPLTATGGLNKFQRPAFGDGRLYATDVNGNVICLGSPVALPLQCSQPVDFGDAPIGTIITKTVNCTALIPTTVKGCSTGDTTWQCSNATLPQKPLNKGDTFQFPVIWNLTQASVHDAQNASFGKVIPGVASTNLNIYTINGVPKYSNILPISLTGRTVSKLPFLTISPSEVDLGGIVLGSDGAKAGLSSSLVLQNVGADVLTFLGSAWTANLGDDDDPVTFNNITNGYLGDGFSSSSLPKVGDTLVTGQGLTIPVNFFSNKTGPFSTFVQWWTTGGNGYVILAGSASTAPVANISVSTVEGGWDSSEPMKMDFGNVLSGTTISRNIRICNSGGSALTITKSKPPIDVELLAPNAGTDLHEAQKIDVNSCALGQVSIVAASLGPNRPDHSVSDVWILNVDDVNFGVHDVSIFANIITSQVGPVLPDGIARYSYLGCYYDGAGRQLSKQTDYPQNENGWCQTNCFKLGYIFAGTEYHTECWCGNSAPSSLKYSNETLKKCEMSCPGAPSQACGGDGTYVSIYYDRTKYTPGTDSIPGIPNQSPGSSNTPSSSVFSSSTISSSAGVTTSPLVTVSTSSTGPPISSSVTFSSPASSSTSTSGPASVLKIGDYSYIGCYTEPMNGRALSGKIYANDSMTVETCYSICAGFTWFGVEYKRECYCGNTLAGGSVLTSEVLCQLTCGGNPLEYCGGSSRLSMYKNTSGTGSAGSPDSPSSSASSVITSLSSTTSGISSASSPFQDSTSSSFQISSSSVQSPSSIGSAPSTAGSSTTTASNVDRSPTSTPTASAIPGFASLGCLSDPAGGPFQAHNMPKLFSNDSMTPDLCISSALARLSATPATTYLFVGLEYGRECYAHTAAPTPEPSSLVGNKACTMKCKGDPSQKCGGANMYNLYAATTASIFGTGALQWMSTPTAATTGA